MGTTKCKICRRIGEKIFLKGERCFSAKCAMVKRDYPPGQQKKRNVKRSLSEYGKELREKQKLRNWYNLRERQFASYIKNALKKRGRVENAAELLIKELELRFDNVVFRMGFTTSKIQARKLVVHRHFLINNKRVNIPSYELKKGDVVSLDTKAKKKVVFNNLNVTFKKHKTPSWIALDVEKLEGKIIGEPTLNEVAPPAEILSIFEFYSR
jgi:small subunit ribosomal protein S4